jgi:cysteine desulfurase
MPMMHGGGHERKMRSGTENVPSIVGFAEAVKIASDKDIKNMGKNRDYLIKNILKIPNTKLNGPFGKNRLCNNINVSFSNIEGEAIAQHLESNGIYVSTGSACASHSLKKSHVLKAIGNSDLDINSDSDISTVINSDTDSYVNTEIKDINTEIKDINTEIKDINTEIKNIKTIIEI